MTDQDLDPILTLAGLDTLMALRGRSARSLAPYAALDHTRIADFASRDARRANEPWLEEAWKLARALGVDDICELIGRPLEEIVLTDDPRDDLVIWRTGCALPLTVAVRLCQRFGLRDPYDLHEVIRMRARNPIVTSTMTMPAVDECSACGGTGPQGHTDACLPGFLWGPRDTPLDVIGVGAQPRQPGRKQIGTSSLGYGLRALRLAQGMSKQDMANTMGCTYVHYTRLEGLKAGLTAENAQMLGRKFGIAPRSLWETPDVLPPAHADAPEVEA